MWIGQVYRLYVGLILSVVFQPFFGKREAISATTRNVAFSAGCILFLSGAIRSAIDLILAHAPKTAS